MVTPLVRAGITCAVVAPPNDAVRHSRRALYLGWADPWDQPDQLLDLLMTHARGETHPVLYFQSDGAMLFVSRHRERLAKRYRFLIADSGLVEDLNDKTRFRVFADRKGLPVPPSGVLDTSTGPVLEAPLQFPVVVKPATWQQPHRSSALEVASVRTRGNPHWSDLMGKQKALHVPDQAALDALWPRFEAWGSPLLAQQLVPGPETAIESYHSYVDRSGELVAEFTGRKLRTRPATYGQSTALTITDAADIRDLGRRVITAAGLIGVSKCDFKRGPNGRIWLLEVNPRFNLWHHPGAIAGVNLPALVHADLTGAPRPPVRAATPGVCWMRAADLDAARAQGMSLSRWLAFAMRCEARRNVAWDDPAPLLRQAVQRVHRSLNRG